MTIAQDVKEAYIKLIEEFEEPVVIIGETIRKDRERNAENL
jgi:CO dehydrogenase/acetyl-CoA synthase epsilon subunit